MQLRPKFLKMQKTRGISAYRIREKTKHVYFKMDLTTRLLDSLSSFFELHSTGDSTQVVSIQFDTTLSFSLGIISFSKSNQVDVVDR